MDPQQPPMGSWITRSDVQTEVRSKRVLPVIMLTIYDRALCTFFSLGQVLPAHRLAHSPDGGPFQPTITQAIRILSAARPRPGPPTEPTTPTSQLEIDTRTHPEYSIPDPFTSGSSPYYYSAPSDPYAYQNPTYHSSYNNKAWVHIFPEGRIHQHPERLMRYHKWGIGRLILESDPAPLFVPIWIEGFENIMHESRQFPRFVPRVLKDVSVTFGKGTGTDEGAFKELRARWRSLVEHERTAVEHDFTQSMSRQSLGSRATDKVHEDELVEFDREEALAERLRNSAEAVHLREECTLRVREEVLKLRQARGWPDEDPKARLVDTWKAEGKLTKREGQMEDGSWIRDT